MDNKAVAIIVMGVSGCGKTSVGTGLSKATGLPFFDGDNFHSKKNIEKMAEGIPLDDEDRKEWLESLHIFLKTHLEKGESLILACSALKESYREILKQDHQDNIVLVYLRGNYDLIHNRMKQREGHYMKATMLRSQFDALEEPQDAFVIDIQKSISGIVEEILHLLKTHNGMNNERS